MTLATWPAALPRPVASAYEAMPREARLAKGAETGPPGYRRRYSSVARQVSLTLLLSRAEKGAFDTFFIHTLKHGSQPFRMPDPVTDGWPLLSSAGAPLAVGEAPILAAASWLCLFGDSLPRETLRGATFAIAFDVWVMP